MSKRELTGVQKVIVSEIPNFFQWHENARKQVERLVENILYSNHAVYLDHKHEDCNNYETACDECLLEFYKWKNDE